LSVAVTPAPLLLNRCALRPTLSSCYLERSSADFPAAMANLIFLRPFTGNILWELYCSYGCAPKVTRILIEGPTNENITP
jgi:hypothetical protein